MPKKKNVIRFSDYFKRTAVRERKPEEVPSVIILPVIRVERRYPAKSRAKR